MTLCTVNIVLIRRPAGKIVYQALKHFVKPAAGKFHAGRLFIRPESYVLRHAFCACVLRLRPVFCACVLRLRPALLILPLKTKNKPHGEKSLHIKLFLFQRAMNI